MAIVYYYAKNENVPIFLKYGIRLSKNKDYELNLNGYQRPYLLGFLNPKDDMTKYSSDEYTCLKLDVLNNHLYVVDFSHSFENGIKIDSKTIDHYYFGSFLKPRVLIDTSVISDQISLYNTIMDIPLLYDNSEDFFYEIQIQKIMEAMPPKEIFEKLATKRDANDSSKNPL